MAVTGHQKATTSAITAGSYSDDKILVSDSGVIKHMTPTEFATEIGAVTESDANTFTAKQMITGSSRLPTEKFITR